MSHTPQFPPLLTGENVTAGTDPFDKAVSQAVAGVDSGTVFYSSAADTLKAALVLAPESDLETALQAVYVAQVGLAESLGALAPPETPIHFVWPNRIKVNAALCGTLRYAAETTTPGSHPNWLVIGIEIPFIPATDDPGLNPEQTCLHAEGCGEVEPMALLESWSKHTLLWLTKYLDDGFEKVHSEWRPRCDTLGQEIETPRAGVFTGLDEMGRMLLRKDGMTETLSLIEFAENA